MKPKKMERQQIIDAANLKKEDRWFDAKLYNNCGEKYYAETYGKGSDECHFEQTTNTSSATICKHCGQEKFLHKQ